MSKYELTDEFIIHNGFKLFRIKSLKSIYGVENGDLGGFVQSYDNLSQEYECWIFEDSKVYENAELRENAHAFGDSEVHGNTIMSGNSSVHGKSNISGKLLISDRCGLKDVTLSGDGDIFTKSEYY